MYLCYKKCPCINSKSLVVGYLLWANYVLYAWDELRQYMKEPKSLEQGSVT